MPEHVGDRRGDGESHSKPTPKPKLCSVLFVIELPGLARAALEVCEV